MKSITEDDDNLSFDSDKDMGSMVCSTEELFKIIATPSESKDKKVEATKVNDIGPVNMVFSSPSTVEKSESSNRINLVQMKQNKIQEDIMNSIETLNYSLFVDIGGSVDTDLNFKRKVGSTELYPIMSATAKGSEEMMRLILMNKTVEINQLNESGVNAFWVACMYGHGGLMKILADKGINIFCKNSNGVNALHLAVEKNFVGIVEMLLGSGFPLDCETDTGMTAF